MAHDVPAVQWGFRMFLGENTSQSLGREQGRDTLAEPRLDQTKTDGRGDLAQSGLDC